VAEKDVFILPGMASGGGAEPDSRDGIHEAYARVLRVCAFAGLTRSDAEDVAQDLFLWLIRQGMPPTVVALPWLEVVAQNFIHRHRRSRRVRNQRESLAAAEAAVFARGDGGAEAVEARVSLDRIERTVPLVEVKLLHLVRRGCSFAEAVRVLGIPRGSRSFFRRRLVGHLAEGLRAPKKEITAANGRPSRCVAGASEATNWPSKRE
jgi:DNA-directed RNA polymerase specialized sigma24 family protein